MMQRLATGCLCIATAYPRTIERMVKKLQVVYLPGQHAEHSKAIQWVVHRVPATARRAASECKDKWWAVGDSVCAADTRSNQAELTMTQESAIDLSELRRLPALVRFAVIAAYGRAREQIAFTRVQARRHQG
jgi:glutathione S-transferase